MGSDDEQSLSDCDGSVTTANTMLDSVPVDVKGLSVSKLRCRLCFSTATELSPLALSTDNNLAHLEWRYYTKKKVQGRVVAKVPRSKLCNWCFKTFFALGWEDEFSITAYAKTIGSTNKERHQKFLSARKATIKSHVKNSARSRMSDGDRKNVSDAATTLDTIAAETTRLHKPKMHFVTTEHWDENLDGKFDPTKVREHNVFGKVEKGIWKRIGREGVYEGDRFEDKTVEERTRETDDSGPLGKLRMDHKKGRLRSLLDNEDKKRNEAAVNGSPVITNVHDIMDLLSSVGLGQAAASGDGEGEKSPSSFSSNSSSESSSSFG